MTQILFNSQIKEYSWMSNMWSAPFELNHEIWKSVECYYQAMKTLVPKERNFIRSLSSSWLAKKEGRKVTVRDDWSKIKLEVMEKGVEAKFIQNSELHTLLVETEEVKLIEYAPWGNTFWSVDRQLKGENHMGKILMKIRSKIRNETKEMS